MPAIDEKTTRLELYGGLGIQVRPIRAFGYAVQPAFVGGLIQLAFALARPEVSEGTARAGNTRGRHRDA
jgi:hypothetical protein